MRLTRRESLVGTGALLAAAPARAYAKASAPSLNQVAALSGRRFGSAVAWAPPGTDTGSFTNPRYAALLERECSLLVPENQLKWQWVRRSPGTFDFRAFDAIADYAAAHNFKLRGHTLFWTPAKWYPKWLAEYDFGPQPARNGREAADRACADGLRPLRAAHLLVRRGQRGGAAGNRPDPRYQCDSCARSRALPRPDVSHRARGSSACAARLQRLYELGADQRRRNPHDGRAQVARGLPQARHAGRRARSPVAHPAVEAAARGAAGPRIRRSVALVHQ